MFKGLKRWFLGDNISSKAVTHSSKGEYNNTNRLSGGGHGQEAINYMNRNSIKYCINHTYANGVRIGDVPNHTHRRKRTGSNQCWFPVKWDRQLIAKAGKSVSRGKKIRDGYIKTGTYRNVKVGIIRTNGKVATIFPMKEQK